MNVERSRTTRVDSPGAIGVKVAAPTRRRAFQTASALLSATVLGCAEPAPPIATPAPRTPEPAALPSAPPMATPSPAIAQPAPPALAATLSPFTGLPVDDPAVLHRRIVAVKIDNAAPARPQLGLSAADLIYEMLAEGGITRFLAMYLAQEPERVGPVRSARLTDIYLAGEWDFLLAYAGAGITTGKLLTEALIPLFKAPELGERLEGTPYLRDPRRPVPHNLFVRVAEVREAAQRDPGIAPEVEIRAFPFQEAPSEAGPLRAITLLYAAGGPLALQSTVSWQYAADAGVWKRVMGGAPHVDALNGQPIVAENVLIQHAEIFTAQNVEPDSAGNPVLDTVLRGKNVARLFHSGQVFEGTWSKEHDRAKTEYRLPNGDPLPFRPGRIWIHIVPTDFRVTWR